LSVTSAPPDWASGRNINVASAERIIHDDDGAGFDLSQGND
jgi:hypothetical protein